VGAAGLLSALSFGIASNVNKDAFRSSITLQDKTRLEIETRTTAAVADVSLLVGLAGAVTAVILFPRGGEPEKAVNVVFAPVLGGGAMAGVGGHF
jgi:hypothetical protein